ncbi:MAG: hypothetical protein WD942_08750 [Dehalococcoidia bacterium]
MKDALLAFLRDLGAQEAVALLERAEFSSRIGPGLWEEPVCYLTVRCSKLDADALESLSRRDRQRIVDAWVHADPDVGKIAEPEPDRLSFEAVPEREARDPLLAELIIQRGLMLDVATGGARFNDVDDYFKARQSRLERQLAARSMTNPVQFESLWDCSSVRLTREGNV